MRCRVRFGLNLVLSPVVIRLKMRKRSSARVARSRAREVGMMIGEEDEDEEGGGVLAWFA